jgi:uncharacterized membrane protein YoaK (UPF0700 family)
VRPLSDRNAFLILLAGLAGWIDAFSFTELGQVFTSFQSGNFIFLGLAIAQGDGERLLGAAVSLTAFLGGTAVGAYVVGRAEVEWSGLRKLAPVFALECALLVGFAACWQVVGEPGAYSAGRIALIVLAASAMGIQGGAVFALRIPGVVTNAMTATLMLGGVLLGLRARDANAGREASPVSAGFLIAMCGSYVASAIVVGVIDAPAVTSAVPGAVLVLILVGLAIRSAVPRGSAVPG